MVPGQSSQENRIEAVYRSTSARVDQNFGVATCLTRLASVSVQSAKN